MGGMLSIWNWKSLRGSLRSHEVFFAKDIKYDEGGGRKGVWVTWIRISQERAQREYKYKGEGGDILQTIKKIEIEENVIFVE